MDFVDLRTAFYPCCGADIAEPLNILRSYVDRVIFCDIDPEKELKYHQIIADIKRSHSASRFIVGDAEKVIHQLLRIDVLFYRGDSGGEGGSGVGVLRRPYLGEVVARMPLPGGLIITNGPNDGGNFKRMQRSRGLEVGGWLITQSEQRPLLQKGLRVFKAEAVGDENGLPRHFDPQLIYF